ncbi:hypothetical protein ACFVH7_36825 [Kitasatospora indigofera]|uniref:hypothetical protein n=1 Tax=Kitasatospora indigofera TaxID=67307 RepID=UPI0036403880
MDITALALVLVPVAGMAIAAVAAVLIVAVSLKGTSARERAGILRAVAHLVRAIRGRK